MPACQCRWRLVAAPMTHVCVVAVGGCSHDSCVWGGGWWLLGWGMTHGRPARLLDTKVANMKGVWQK